MVTAQSMPNNALAPRDRPGMAVLTGTVLHGMVPHEAFQRGTHMLHMLILEPGQELARPKGMSCSGLLMNRMASTQWLQAGVMYAAQLHRHGMSLHRIYDSLAVSLMRSPGLAGNLSIGRSGMAHKSHCWSRLSLNSGIQHMLQASSISLGLENDLATQAVHMKCLRGECMMLIGSWQASMVMRNKPSLSYGLRLSHSQKSSEGSASHVGNQSLPVSMLKPTMLLKRSAWTEALPGLASRPR